METGLIVILIGTVFLLKNVGLLVGIDWSFVWPLLVIALGLGMIEREDNGKRRKGKKCEHCDHVWR